MPHVDAATTPAAGRGSWPAAAPFAQASSDGPADWWAPGQPETLNNGAMPLREPSRSVQVSSTSPHTTPTSPMNQSRQLSQLFMSRLDSDSDPEQAEASSCDGDLGPCTSDGMPVSAPSSAFNTGPGTHTAHQPGPQTLSLAPLPLGSSSGVTGRADLPAPLDLPPPPCAGEPVVGGIVGLSTVGLEGDSGAEQKASLDSSASMWSPLLTTGMAALQTMGGTSSGRGDLGAVQRLPAAPSLQSWAGSSLDGGPAGFLPALASTRSSPVPAACATGAAPSPVALLHGIAVGADAHGQDSSPGMPVSGSMVALSMLAQVIGSYPASSGCQVVH